METIPFDAKMALKHPERVIARNGRRILEICHLSKRKSLFCLFVIMDNGALETDAIDGRRNMKGDSGLDLFLIPEIKYIPFTNEDWPLFMGKIACWESKKGTVSYCNEQGLSVNMFGFANYQQALETFTFPDGTPFGKKVSS